MLCYAKSPEWTLSSTYMSHTLGKLTSRIIDRRLKYTSTDYKYSHIKRKRILLSENLFFRIFINWTHQNANGSMKSEFSSKPTLCVHRSNNVAQIWKKNRRDFVWNCRCWRSCLPPLYSQVECSCEYLSSIVKKLFVWLVKLWTVLECVHLTIFEQIRKNIWIKARIECHQIYLNNGFELFY